MPILWPYRHRPGEQNPGSGLGRLEAVAPAETPALELSPAENRGAMLRQGSLAWDNNSKKTVTYAAHQDLNVGSSDKLWGSRRRNALPVGKAVSPTRL